MADQHGAAREIEQRLFERAQRVDVEIVRGLVEQQQVAALLEQLRQVHAVSLAARQRADLPLLRPALEIEPRHVGARRDLPLAELDLVVATGNLVPHALVGVEGFATLVHVANPHGVTDFQRAAVRLLLSRDHPEQRRLAGAIGPDHPDDAAAGQREGESLDEQVVGIPLAEISRLDDHVAEARPRSDVDLGRLDLLRGVLAQEILVRVQPRLALRLPRARRHANPFKLPLERPLPARLGFLLLRQTVLLLLQPGRIVALPRDAAPAIELENPAGDVVEEISVVRDRDDGARVVLEEALQPRDRFGVEMVRRLVEQQQIGRLQQKPAQRHPAPLAARQRRDVGVRRRQAERVHRQIEARVEVPGVGGLDPVLDARLFIEDLLHGVGRQILPQPGVDLVVPREQRLERRHALFDVAQDVLGGVEPGLLLKEPDRDPLGRGRLAEKGRVFARHDLQERALSRAVQSEHADLRAEIEREPDVVENPGVGRIDLPEAFHGVDELGHGQGQKIAKVQSSEFRFQNSDWSSDYHLQSTIQI